MSQWNLGSTSVSQVVRVPALGLNRVIHGVEVCCCGREQEHVDGRMEPDSHVLQQKLKRDGNVALKAES